MFNSSVVLHDVLRSELFKSTDKSASHNFIKRCGLHTMSYIDSEITFRRKHKTFCRRKQNFDENRNDYVNIIPSLKNNISLEMKHLNNESCPMKIKNMNSTVFRRRCNKCHKLFKNGITYVKHKRSHMSETKNTPAIKSIKNRASNINVFNDKKKVSENFKLVDVDNTNKNSEKLCEKYEDDSNFNSNNNMKTKHLYSKNENNIENLWNRNDYNKKLNSKVRILENVDVTDVPIANIDILHKNGAVNFFSQREQVYNKDKAALDEKNDHKMFPHLNNEEISPGDNRSSSVEINNKNYSIKNRILSSIQRTKPKNASLRKLLKDQMKCTENGNGQNNEFYNQSSDATFRCKKCDKIYPFEHQMRFHIKLHERQEKQLIAKRERETNSKIENLKYNCEYCDLWLEDCFQLKRHQVARHGVQYNTVTSKKEIDVSFKNSNGQETLKVKNNHAISSDEKKENISPQLQHYHVDGQILCNDVVIQNINESPNKISPVPRKRGNQKNYSNKKSINKRKISPSPKNLPQQKTSTDLYQSDKLSNVSLVSVKSMGVTTCTVNSIQPQLHPKRYESIQIPKTCIETSQHSSNVSLNKVLDLPQLISDDNPNASYLTANVNNSDRTNVTTNPQEFVTANFFVPNQASSYINYPVTDAMNSPIILGITANNTAQILSSSLQNHANMNVNMQTCEQMVDTSEDKITDQNNVTNSADDFNVNEQIPQEVEIKNEIEITDKLVVTSSMTDTKFHVNGQTFEKTVDLSQYQINDQMSQELAIKSENKVTDKLIVTCATTDTNFYVNGQTSEEIVDGSQDQNTVCSTTYANFIVDLNKCEKFENKSENKITDLNNVTNSADDFYVNDHIYQEIAIKNEIEISDKLIVASSTTNTNFYVNGHTFEKTVDLSQNQIIDQMSQELVIKSENKVTDKLIVTSPTTDTKFYVPGQTSEKIVDGSQVQNTVCSTTLANFIVDLMKWEKIENKSENKITDQNNVMNSATDFNANDHISQEIAIKNEIEISDKLIVTSSTTDTNFCVNGLTFEKTVDESQDQNTVWSTIHANFIADLKKWEKIENRSEDKITDRNNVRNSEADFNVNDQISHEIEIKSEIEITDKLIVTSSTTDTNFYVNGQMFEKTLDLSHHQINDQMSQELAIKSDNKVTDKSIVTGPTTDSHFYVNGQTSEKIDGSQDQKTGHNTVCSTTHANFVVDLEKREKIENKSENKITDQNIVSGTPTDVIVNTNAQTCERIVNTSENEITDQNTITSITDFYFQNEPEEFSFTSNETNPITNTFELPVMNINGEYEELFNGDVARIEHVSENEQFEPQRITMNSSKETDSNNSNRFMIGPVPLERIQNCATVRKSRISVRPLHELMGIAYNGSFKCHRCNKYSERLNYINMCQSCANEFHVQCVLCGKYCYSFMLLNIHREREHRCRVCNNDFQNVNAHMQNVQRCPFCVGLFCQQEVLFVHLRTIHKMIPQREMPRMSW